MEDWLLVQYVKIEAVKAEIEGMKALNQYRIDRDETIAYVDDAFQEKANYLWGISQVITERLSHGL